MKKEGMNCRECGWPMEANNVYCPNCGAEYVPKKEDVAFKIVENSFKGIIFIIFLIPALLISIIAFPFGLLSLILPAGMYYEWWGPGKNLEKCRCCHKRISKEAEECPKCGCPRPIY